MLGKEQIKSYFSEEERKKHHDVLREQIKYDLIAGSVFWRVNCLRMDVIDYLEAEEEEIDEALEHIEFCIDRLKEAVTKVKDDRKPKEEA